MFFREVLNEDLGCGSYVVADGGEAAVVDPKWEIEEYLQIAEDNGFKISRILETQARPAGVAVEAGVGHAPGLNRCFRFSSSCFGHTAASVSRLYSAPMLPPFTGHRPASCLNVYETLFGR